MKSFRFKLLLLSLLLVAGSLTSCSASASKQTDTAAVKAVSEQADTSRITIFFAGDAMQHQGQLDAAKKVGGSRYDYSECFTLIAPTIREADYAVCNLEVPLGGGPRYSGYPCFSAPDSYAQALKDAGFDMLLTANNHCLDSGDRAAQRTLTALDSLGLDHVGTYLDAAQRRSLVPFIKDIKGVKFGFLNYTYGTNGIEPKAGTEIAMIDRADMAREIKATKDAGADVVIVLMHWGIEYVLSENESQRLTAQFLADNGADLIIGSHPHVVQPIKEVTAKDGRKVPVVYSLGNLISNMKTDDTQGGAWAEVTFTRPADGEIIISGIEYDTFFSAKPYGAHRNYRVVPREKYHTLPAHQQKAAKIFERGASRAFSNNINASRRNEIR